LYLPDSIDECEGSEDGGGNTGAPWRLNGKCQYHHHLIPLGEFNKSSKRNWVFSIVDRIKAGEMGYKELAIARKVLTVVAASQAVYSHHQSRHEASMAPG
jgi:hypothetical protein